MLRVFPLLECFLKFPKCSCNSRTREKRFFQGLSALVSLLSRANPVDKKCPPIFTQEQRSKDACRANYKLGYLLSAVCKIQLDYPQL